MLNFFTSILNDELVKGASKAAIWAAGVLGSTVFLDGTFRVARRVLKGRAPKTVAKEDFVASIAAAELACLEAKLAEKFREVVSYSGTPPTCVADTGLISTLKYMNNATTTEPTKPEHLAEIRRGDGVLFLRDCPDLPAVSFGSPGAGSIPEGESVRVLAVVGDQFMYALGGGLYAMANRRDIKPMGESYFIEADFTRVGGTPKPGDVKIGDSLMFVKNSNRAMVGSSLRVAIPGDVFIVEEIQVFSSDECYRAQGSGTWAHCDDVILLKEPSGVPMTSAPKPVPSKSGTKPTTIQKGDKLKFAVNPTRGGWVNGRRVEKGFEFTVSSIDLSGDPWFFVGEERAYAGRDEVVYA